MKFTCVNCVTVSKDLQEVVASQDPSIISRDKAEIKRLRKVLAACENLLKIHHEKQKILLDNIKRLEVRILQNYKSSKVSQAAQSKKFEEKVENLITEKMNEIHEKIKPSQTYAGAVNAPPSF